MDYWQSVLQEVLHKHDEDYPCAFTSVKDSVRKVKEQQKPYRRGISDQDRICDLNERFPGKYLTERETQCAQKLVKGLTNAEVGRELGLSTRTIEFYVRNMRTKLQVSNKNELVDCLKSVKLDLKKYSQVEGSLNNNARRLSVGEPSAGENKSSKVTKQEE